MLAAIAASMIFGYLTLTLASNQVATGLALTIFGVGLSSMIGEGFVGTTIPPFGPVFPAALAEHPVLRARLRPQPARLRLARHDGGGRLVPRSARAPG